MAVCRSCGAEILWTLTRNRAKMPLDRAPVEPGQYSGPTGALFALVDGTGPDTVALSLNDLHGGHDLWRSGDIKARVSHFSSCPSASKHRKPRPLSSALAERTA